MRSFACGHCGQLVFFENSVCLNCSTPLGFVADELEIVALEGESLTRLHRCANAGLALCNWMVSAPGRLCCSCELTRTRPADTDAEGLRSFAVTETAKRRVIAQLLELGLPGVRPGELAFDLLSSALEPVATGHSDGVITIDLAESDDARREARRQELSEPYRTVLGHLRHELGHYFQPLIVTGDEQWANCRALFGDERQDYEAAIARHYDTGAPDDWSERYVSAYATMHPWEDWAETFAHYLHIRDTLQTAAEYGVSVSGPRAVAEDETLQALNGPEAPAELVTEPDSFAELIAEWLPLTYALNAVNRSMGRDDLYPFTLAREVTEKLEFVHQRVVGAGSTNPISSPSSGSAPTGSRS